MKGKSTDESHGMDWYFDQMPRGSSVGSVDASQEHYKGDPLDSTVREVIQNSLDAARSSKPVNICMELVKIPCSDIKASRLRPHFEQALKRAKDEGHREDAQESFKNAQDLLLRNEMTALAITDTGTTGLVGNTWKALIHSEGVTSKSGRASGGSFGIGKNATYLTSDIRTVFYYTKYTAEKSKAEKLIGRCKLITHTNPEDKSQRLDPNGFFCDGFEEREEDYTPLEGGKIPKVFRRGDSAGTTSIFIAGFNHHDDWKTKAAQSVANNFFMAILDKKLAVRIEGKTIGGPELRDMFETGDDLFASPYYMLTKEQDHVMPITSSFGDFNLLFRVSREADDKLPNRLAYINRKGMLITADGELAKNPFAPRIGASYSKYVAILQAADDETDQKIRQLETPTHQSIEIKRAEHKSDFKKIKEGLQEARRNIREAIKAVMERPDPDDQSNIGELSQFIPMDGGRRPKGGDYAPILTIEKRRPVFGTRGVDVDIVGGDADAPRPRPRKPPGDPKSRRRQSEEPGGRIIPSSLKSTNIKLRGDTMRIWLHTKEGIKSLKFRICAAGEQVRNRNYVIPSDIRIVSGGEFPIGLDGSLITMESPPTKSVVEVKVDAVSYSGYMIMEIREAPKD